MAVREVLRVPHPALKQPCPPVDPADLARARAVAGDLLDTMRAFPGCVGVAAPQIGEMTRLVAVDVSEHPKAAGHHGELLLVNPAIERAEGAEVAREGCLSIPELTANVRRAVRVTIAALRPDGRPVRLEAEGFEARCLAHEIDHLDGILFLDRVDSLASDVFRRRRRAPSA